MTDDAGQFTVDEIIDAIQRTYGFVHLAAKYLECAPDVIERYAAEHPEVQQAITQNRGKVVELAESRLLRALADGDKWAIELVLSGKAGRDKHGHFAPGNQYSLKSGGYGAEAQVYGGKISERLMEAVHRNLERILAGGAGELHDAVTALVYSVMEGLQKTYADATGDYEGDGSEANELRRYRADRALHSWSALAARLLEWREEHPHDDTKTLDVLLGKDSGNGD